MLAVPFDITLPVHQQPLLSEYLVFPHVWVRTHTYCTTHTLYMHIALTLSIFDSCLWVAEVIVSISGSLDGFTKLSLMDSSSSSPE
jgi:hypothetical protein